MDILRADTWPGGTDRDTNGDSAIWRENALLVPPVEAGLSDRLKSSLTAGCTTADFVAVDIVEQARPHPLRPFDQIPMRSLDLLLQVKLIAPYLAGKSVAFVGDYDGTSLVLGLLSKLRRVASPAYMLLLDFDGRLLGAARQMANQYGFDALLETRLYNVFDPVPPELVGQFDWFYTNPPYGCRNNGESARLFVTRGCELAHSDGAKGCIILPDDERRPWTRAAMAMTQVFLCQHGWTIDEKIGQVHQYHLDDDQNLVSSMMLVGCQATSNPCT